MGQAAKPAVPALLFQMERLVREEDDTVWVDESTGDSFSTFYIVLALEDIDPHWQRTLSGREVARRLNDRIQSKLQQDIRLHVCEDYVLEKCRVLTPGLKRALVQETLAADDYHRNFYLGLLDDSWPGWADSPEIGLFWKWFDQRYSGPDPPVGDRLFLRLLLHHPDIPPVEKIRHLLRLVPGKVADGVEIARTLEEVDSEWYRNPVSREAVPMLWRHLNESRNSIDQNLSDYWPLLGRIPMPLEHKWEPYCWLLDHAYILDQRGFDGECQLPANQEELRLRMLKLDPHFFQLPVADEHRTNAYSNLVSPEESDRYLGFYQLQSWQWTERPGGAFQELPQLLLQLAAWKEKDPKDHKTAALLRQVVLRLRQQKVLQEDILIP